MAKEVVAKRGCTCCGTGCVLIGAVFPVGMLAAWETLGVFAAVALWPTVIAGAHTVRARTKRSPAANL